MEKLKGVYVIELFGRLKPEYDVCSLTRKVGCTFYSKTSDRGITAEYLKSANGGLSPGMPIVTVTEEKELFRFNCPAPLADNFEQWAHKTYLNKCSRTFLHMDALHEYYSTVSSTTKTDHIARVGAKLLDQFNVLNQRYLELNDSQVLSIEQIVKEYEILIDTFKKKLLSYESKKGGDTKKKPVSAPPPPPTTNANKNAQPTGAENVYDHVVLLKNFYLYIDDANNKAYLQGRDNSRHQLEAGKNIENTLVPSMKNPKVFQQAWSANLLDHRSRFQWHDAKWARPYSPRNPVAITIIDLFKMHGTLGTDWFKI